MIQRLLPLMTLAALAVGLTADPLDGANVFAAPVLIAAGGALLVRLERVRGAR